jgi:hypothetical protein
MYIYPYILRVSYTAACAPASTSARNSRILPGKQIESIHTRVTLPTAISAVTDPVIKGEPPLAFNSGSSPCGLSAFYLMLSSYYIIEAIS